LAAFVASAALGALFFTLGSDPLAGLVVWPLALTLTAVSAVFVAKAVWLSLTQTYKIDELQVEIRTGLFSRAYAAIPGHSIAIILANKPLPLRLLGVGSVVLFTNDGLQYSLHNLRSPDSITSVISEMTSGPGGRLTSA
jgi:membrane protein YdbS with pleckstrin-like domain